MEDNPLRIIAAILEAEFQWLQSVLDTRIQLYFKNEASFQNLADIPAPDLSSDESPYSQFVRQHNMTIRERLVFLLALAPHFRPEMLDIFFTKNANYDRCFTEFGGVNGINHRGFIPTGETAVFLLSGGDLTMRLQAQALFSKDHYFSRLGILTLSNTHPGEPLLSGVLSTAPEYINYFSTGVLAKPDYHPHFPARLITTKLTWDDLVLDPLTMEQIKGITDWMRSENTLRRDWGMDEKLKDGYRCFFYGPAGTGKTLSASLLGKALGLDVYRIDPSEAKDISPVIDQAANKNWILLFECESEEDISHALQLTEGFPGLVILSSREPGDVDRSAFQSIIYFGMPGAQERLQLWYKSIPEKMQPETGLDLDEIASEYELSGGTINNVIRYCAISALKQGNNQLMKKDIIDGIRHSLLFIKN